MLRTSTLRTQAPWKWRYEAEQQHSSIIEAIIFDDKLISQQQQTRVGAGPELRRFVLRGARFGSKSDSLGER